MSGGWTKNKRLDSLKEYGWIAYCSVSSRDLLCTCIESIGIHIYAIKNNIKRSIFKCISYSLEIRGKIKNVHRNGV